MVALLVIFLRGGSSEPTSPLLTETPAPTESSVPFAERDTDGDGLTDEQEVAAGTDIATPDTDGDGYTDKQELDAGFDPKGPGMLDQDRDGLPDRHEEQLGTDARNADTDGDGYLDGQEVQNCYNPRIPSPDDKIAACPPYPGL